MIKGNIFSDLKNRLIFVIGQQGGGDQLLSFGIRVFSEEPDLLTDIFV